MKTKLWWATVLLLAAASVAIGYVATQHWRWLYSMENSEHVRLRSVIGMSTFRLKTTFDDEMERLEALFRDTSGGREQVAAQLEGRLAIWQQATRWPALLEDVFLIEQSKEGVPTLERFDAGGARFVRMTWPSELGAVQRYLSAPTNVGRTLLGPRDGTAVRVVSAVPAILVPTHGGEWSPSPVGETGTTWLVLKLDATYLWERFFPELLSIFFAQPNFEPIELIVRDSVNHEIVFARPPGSSFDDFQFSEFAVGLLDAGTDGEELPRVALRPSRGAEALTNWDDPPNPDDHLWFRDHWAQHYYSGHWQLFLRRSGASFGDQVQAARMRSVRISFVVLGLICAAVVLIVGLARYAQRLAQQQMAFVASVSHELRTPLAVLSAAGDNLADSLVDEKAQLEEYGRVIQDETQRLRDMVENVLHLARKSAPVPRMTMTPLEVTQQVEEVLRRTSRQCEQSAFAVEKAISPVPATILGNGHAFQSALLNLISNALKYGRASRWLRVSVETVAESGCSEVRISVEDRGPGIEPADRPRLFEPFFRGRRAQEELVEGSGLGLALVRDVVEAHGGRVSVDSELGVGSRFTLHFPHWEPS